VVRGPPLGRLRPPRLPGAPAGLERRRAAHGDRNREAGALRRAAGWGGGRRNSTTLGLSPLSDEDTGALVAARFWSAPFSRWRPRPPCSSVPAGTRCMPSSSCGC
jgi:hypothetical protein